MDLFGILLHGNAFAALNNMRLKSLSVGDMIGFMSLSEMTTQTKNKYDIVAETDGLIAVLILDEIKLKGGKEVIPVRSI